MNCFELPASIISELHGVLAKYWWGSSGEKKKIHWASWKRLCGNKLAGGLGFRDLHVFNLALLAKQGWRLIHNPESMVARLFKAKYFPDCSFMEATLTSNSSYTWRSIMCGRVVLEVGTRFRIGDGTSVGFWKDRWLPRPHSFKPFSVPPQGLEMVTVSSFIDLSSRTWKEDELRAVVTNFEADQILQIPIGEASRMDVLMWHYDRKGNYTVKSGYWAYSGFLARELASGSNSKDKATGNQFWKRLWSLCIPPKVRIFVWRAVCGFIPTRVSLSRRHIELADLSCVLCGDMMETEEHLWRECCRVKEFWSLGDLTEVASRFGFLNFADWLQATVVHACEEVAALFLVHVWSIWEVRNDKLWNTKNFSPIFLSRWATVFYEEYKAANCEVAGRVQKRPPIRWSCPPSGRLKVNIDGAYDASTSVGGVGVIVRNHEGSGIAVIARSFAFAYSPLSMELLALRESLHLAIHQGWSNICIESDSILLISAMNETKGDLSEHGVVLADCKVLAEMIETITFSHVYREANQVADRLALVAKGTRLNQTWLSNMPDFITDVLLEDIYACNNSIPSQGITSPRNNVSASSNINDFGERESSS